MEDSGDASAPVITGRRLRHLHCACQQYRRGNGGFHHVFQFGHGAAT
jgi:hypothetical protein